MGTQPAGNTQTNDMQDTQPADLDDVWKQFVMGCKDEDETKITSHAPSDAAKAAGEERDPPEDTSSATGKQIPPEIPPLQEKQADYA